MFLKELGGVYILYFCFFAVAILKAFNGKKLNIFISKGMDVGICVFGWFGRKEKPIYLNSLHI